MLWQLQLVLDLLLLYDTEEVHALSYYEIKEQSRMRYRRKPNRLYQINIIKSSLEEFVFHCMISEYVVLKHGVDKYSSLVSMQYVLYYTYEKLRNRF